MGILQKPRRARSPGRYPAIVKSYDQATRTCRVEIPGVTDGGDALPDAEIEYPIGDKSRLDQHSTELEMLAGDTVWVAFIEADSRRPLITGYRNPRAGNDVNWRRIHHANIALTADGVLNLTATTINLNATTVNITATDTDVKSKLKVTGGALIHNSKSISDTHTHAGVKSGPDTTGAPS